MKGIFMNTTINLLIKKLLPYIFIALFAYVLNTVLFSFLSKKGVNFIKNDEISIEYKKYSGFYTHNVNKVEAKQETQKEVESMRNYNLKAIYSMNDNSGWISLEKANSSFILSQWEEIDGYILTKLFKNYVIFEKAAVEYKLEIKKTADEKVSYDITQKSGGITENIIVSDDSIKIKRDYLNSYVNDIDKVWSNIAIKEIKKDKKIDGFEVFKVAKDSVFDKLGLKQGDIIKSINNNVLGSYADAFEVYNNINNTKYLNIEILRDNEIMELNYEIN